MHVSAPYVLEAAPIEHDQGDNSIVPLWLLLLPDHLHDGLLVSPASDSLLQLFLLWAVFLMIF